MHEKVLNTHVITLPHTLSETVSNKEAATSTIQNRSERRHILQHTEPRRCSKPAAATGTAMEFGGAEDAQRGLHPPCYERRRAKKVSEAASATRIPEVPRSTNGFHRDWKSRWKIGPLPVVNEEALPLPASTAALPAPEIHSPETHTD